MLEARDKCEENVRVLLEDMADSLDCIADVRQFVRLAQLKRALGEVDPLMREAVNFLARYISKSPSAKIIAFVTFSTETENQLASLTARFLSFKRKFDRGLAVQSGMAVMEIRQASASMEEQLKFLLDESVLRREDDILQRLKSRSLNATQRHEMCLEGTRIDILGAVDEWIHDLHAPNIFWLHGHPGTGKSAIAATVRDRLLRAGRLGASFFFRREDFAAQTPEALWCSVAYDLAQKHPSIRTTVVEKLTSREVDPDVTGHYEIFNELIAIPLSSSVAVAPGSLPVVVIDALDECGGLEEARSYQEKVLRGLTHWRSLPSQFKIFVTSRNEGSIGTVLRSGQLRCRFLEVGDSVTGNSTMDITNYLRHGFDQILEDFTTIPRPWPSSSEMKILTDAAAGLFIWASTVLKIVAAGQPTRELDAVLDMIRTGNVIGEMDRLTQLYKGLLASKFRTRPQMSMFKEIAGTIIAARIPLSSQDLLNLLQTLTVTDIEFFCKQLGSVLGNNSGLRFLHHSFVDFLVTISADSGFHYSVIESDYRLAKACISIMKRKLHFNMGNITTSYLRNSDIPGLAERIPEYVYYSCRFWTSHLRTIGDLRNEIRDLLQLHLLGWLEVLSIRSAVGAATESLESLFRLLLDNDELKQLTSDALSFLRSFATPISSAVPHIYLSALAVSPRTSRTRRNYIGSIQGLIEIKSGGDEDWSVLQGILAGHTNCVWSAAFSPDGRRIVSASDDAIYIWDADTQIRIGEPLQGHSGSVWSVAFSGDGRWIVSGGDDQTIRVWDANTHLQVGEVLQGHSDSVFSVAFSPDGQNIISGSGDHTVRLWDTNTRKQVGRAFEGHLSTVFAVAFSPDGRRIVSGSEDHTVRLWDVSAHVQIGETLRGHSETVFSVAFSPDGIQIASGSEDSTVCIWEADTQVQTGEALQGHSDAVHCVAFSPDGRHVVSGSGDYSIQIWDAHTHMQVPDTLFKHSEAVWCVAFSPDGLRIVSGSSDYSVRLWDAKPQMRRLDQTTQGHSDTVWSVAVSPDGRYIVSGSEDHTLRIWDSNTQVQVGETLQGHTAPVFSVDFSPDGCRIVSGSGDNSIRLWDPDTQLQLGDTLHEHRSWVYSVVFSPDGRKIISGSADHTVRIWNADTQTQMQVGILQGHSDTVLSVACSPDSRHIVSGSEDQTIRIWDVNTRMQVGRVLQGHTGNVHSLSFSPDGQYILSGSEDCTIRVWDVKTQMEVGEALQGHWEIWCVAFSPNGQQIASGSGDYTVRVWDAEARTQLGDAFEGQGGTVWSVAYSPDGRRVVAGCTDSVIHIWDVVHMQERDSDSVGPLRSEHGSISGREKLNHDLPLDRISLLDPNTSHISSSVTIRKDGWLVGPNGELLLWIPHHLIPRLPQHRLLGFLSSRGPMISFDTSRFFHGDEWTRCVAG
ncbi:hypothetical protein DFH08DRAFT_432364 [Mycena albidolilacea]|uniref:NACHT domain-containing protein n=1 Tax=Mycena albidolilacea TaxID=1033008 RepID=A0AAD6Z9U2_9AGAR|nr:hypothetical protein DFH08DRAFT_432364 [Mycena albidolilacea]